MTEQIKSTEEAWSLNGEEYTHDSLAELITDEEIEAGATVWRGTARRPDPADYVDAEDVIDAIAERAWQEAGEFAEGYPNVSDEAREQLQAMLESWAREHARPDFFLVEDGKKYTVTAEDVAAAREGKSDE